MKKHRFIAFCLVSALLSSSPTLAKPGHGRGRGKEGKEKGRVTAPIAEREVAIDRDGHRRIVTEYFSRESLPPGLAKRALRSFHL